MPQVIPAIAAWVATAVQSVSVAGSYWVAYYGTQIALYYGISRAITKRPSIPSLRAQGVEVNVRDPAAPRQVIYGQRRVSGILYPVGVSGSNNEYLHLLLLIAGHECEELGEVTFNDEVVPFDGSGNATGRYAGFVRVRKHTGAYAQTVDTALQSDLGSGYWSNDHRLRGIAYLYVRLKVSSDLFPGGIPEIYCLVKGRKVYDHREGGHDPADYSTWTWSANSALCLVDWVRGVPTLNSAGGIVRNHGVGALDSEIDYTAADAAANICDEEIELADESTEPRYASNGTMPTSTLPADGIEMLKAAMAGECVFIGGSWVVLAGAYRTPTLAAFDDGDLRAPITGARLKPAVTDLFNVGRGLYISAGNNWQPTDVPQVPNSTYKAEDGGIDLPVDMEFHFTTSHAAAQRLLKIAIERSRQGITFVAKCKLNALQVQPGDVILWSDPDLGWSSKPFEVLSVVIVAEADENGHPYLGVDLTLKETASGVWDWANGEETTVDLAPNTLLRSPFDIENPTSLSVTNAVQQQAEGTAVPRLQVSWAAPADANVTTRGFIRIEYKLAAASDWLPVDLVRGDITTVFIMAVVIGQTYDVRVRSENDLFFAPTWESVTGTTVTGDTTAPAAPTGLAAAVGTGKAVSLDWSDNTEDDFSEYKVFRNTTNNSGTATEIAEVRASRFVDVDVAIGTHYFYWLKAVDTSENVSGFSGGVNATPTTVPEGSVDSTAPSTPSAPTFVSEATYLAGDGTVFARITIACPSLPAGAKLNQILYRVSGATLWTIADEMAGSGNLSIGDLSPGQGYEFAVRAISFANVPSTVSSTLSRTAPNKTTGPGVPTSIVYTAGNDASFRRPAYFAGGVLFRSTKVSWTEPADADVLYYEWVWRTVDSPTGGSPVGDGAGVTFEPEVVLSLGLPLTSYFYVRSIDRTGNASSWAGGGTNVASYLEIPAGDAAGKNTGTTSGTVAAGDDSRITGAAQKASNLGDLASASAARSNLGLDSMATQDAGGVAITGGAINGCTSDGFIFSGGGGEVVKFAWDSSNTRFGLFVNGVLKVLINQNV